MSKGSTPAPRVAAPHAAPPGPAFVRPKTKECRFFFAEGSCAQGAACTFAHEAVEKKGKGKKNRAPKQAAKAKVKQPVSLKDAGLVAAATMGKGKSQKEATGPKRSKIKRANQTCRQFQAGSCRLGAKCQFVHARVKEKAKEAPKATVALEDPLFGWRSFVCSSLERVERGVCDRLVYSGISDLKVNVLVREVGKRNLHCYFSAECEVSVQKLPFVVQQAKGEGDAVVAYLSQLGSCVTFLGMVERVGNAFAASFAKSVAAREIEEVLIGKVKMVQLAGCCLPLPDSRVLRVDCTADSSNRPEVVVLKPFGPASARDFLKEFCESGRYGATVDPMLTDNERKTVEEAAVAMGLKFKREGAATIVWKPASFTKAIARGKAPGQQIRDGGKEANGARAGQAGKSRGGDSGGQARMRRAANGAKCSAPQRVTVVKAHQQKPAAVAPLVRDNSNQVAFVVPAVVPRATPSPPLTQLWICVVCEAENARTETVCCVCEIERETSEDASSGGEEEEEDEDEGGDGNSGDEGV